MHVFCAVTTRMRIPFVERYERWSSTCGRNIVVLNWKRRKISRWSHSYVMGCLGTVRSKPQIQSDCSTLIRRRCPVKNVVIRWHDVSTQPTALGDAHTCSYGWCRATWCGASHNLNIYHSHLIHLCKTTASSYQISSITRCILMISCKINVHRYLTAQDIRSATREIGLRVPSAPVFSFVSEQTTSPRFSP